MVRGDRRHDRQMRLRQIRPESPDERAEALGDRRIVSIGIALIVVACLAALIRWLWP